MHRKAQKSQEQNQNQNQNISLQQETVLKFLLKLCLVLLAIWVAFTYVFGIRQVSGENMYPRLRDGDLILYYRLEQDYQEDDVVAFDIDGYHRVGRIVAQGGDVVDLNTDGQLVVNGNVRQEEVFYATEPLVGGVSFPYTVEEGSYFVLCDFRTASVDSRSYGTIPQSDLAGKVITLLRRRGI
jgi:signal peptidase I